MNELLKVNTTNEQVTVSARDLYEFVQSQERFSKWFDRMASYGFEEGNDYQPVQKSTVVNNGALKEIGDYQLTVGMGKEIAMLQRNEKGKQARKYFIQIEEAWNTPEKIMERALLIAKDRINNLTVENTKQQQVIGELKPKADYLDRILKSNSLVTVTQIAKDYGMSATSLNRRLNDLEVQFKQSNQWLLYKKYHGLGYTHSETFVIDEIEGFGKTVMNTKWTQKGRLFLYNLLKDNGILPVIEQHNKH